MKCISEALIRDEIEFAARFDEERVRRLGPAIGPIKIGWKAIDDCGPNVTVLNKSPDFRTPSDLDFANAIYIMGPPD